MVKDAAQLAPHYSRFQVAERMLLTGHSHQAWPDVSFDAQQRAWLDAARWVDDKWPVAMGKADRVRGHWRRLLGDTRGDIALGQNTHELVTRLLSALPLEQRPRLVSTDGEFHTLSRQLARLAEAGLEVVVVPARPAETLSIRLAERVDDRTACTLVSSVLFATAEIVPDLAAVAAACDRYGSALLVDAYHHLNVVPFDIAALALDGAFITGGGYKYCQLGEGNAFLRVPEGCRLRPVLTGWYAEFASLEQADTRGRVPYGRGAAAFGGATYDPTAHYRAEAVFDFHVEQGLTPQVLREISQRQVARLRAGIEALDVDPALAMIEPVPEERRGGFLAVRAPGARELARRLLARGLHCDARGELLRLGPAPYLSDSQLDAAVGLLGEEVNRSR